MSYISLPFGFVVSEITKHLLFNDPLQQNTNLRNLLWEPSVHVYSDDSSPCLYPLQQLAQQLRGGPYGPQLRLKRVKCLPCVSEYVHSLLDFQESLPQHSCSEIILLQIFASL